MSQQYVTGQQWDNTCSPTAVLSVVSEWVIGYWLWIHVMDCAHDFSPLDTQTMPTVYPFSWKTWQSYQRSIQQSMMLSWRECVLYNGVIRSATVVVLDMVAVTHIIKPQRASMFGEYTHMQLRLSALWIGYGIGKTCKDIPIHHISQIKCLDLNIVKCCPSMLSQGAM